MYLGLSFPSLPRLRHQRGEAVVRDAGAHGGVTEAIEVRVEVALEGGVALVLGRRAHGRRRTC
jgi:preprotein translocase subunit YajC